MWFFGLVFGMNGTALAQPSVNWWLDSNDSQLVQCIEAGLSESPDIHIAMARLRQAQAISAQQISAFVPSITASWNSTTHRSSITQTLLLSCAPEVRRAPDNHRNPVVRSASI